MPIIIRFLHMPRMHVQVRRRRNTSYLAHQWTVALDMVIFDWCKSQEPPDITCPDLMGSLEVQGENRAPTTQKKAMDMARLVRVHPLYGVEQIAQIGSHVIDGLHIARPLFSYY
ncbi:hypothetical protein F66182_4645 [Fusarium sp. NRRL 66182]|nr:hypothetical protein F66182_4645 [Fusarium sp. NRRL 66182]